jgi:hypothetical protein
MAVSRGRCPPLDPSISLGVPDVSRLCPLQDRFSKARSTHGFPAQSKSTEPLFGRGRQSANPRITGGLVSPDQVNNASSPARRHPGHGHGQQMGGNLCRLVCLRGAFPRWQPRAEGHTPAATISRYRAVGRRAGRQNAGAPGCPATGPRRTPRSQHPRNQTPSPAAPACRRRRWPADHCAMGRRFAVGVRPRCGIPAGHRP